MPDRNTVKTLSRDMRHDETWKLETRAKTRHTNVETEPRTRHEQELTRKWDSERELLCSAPRKLPNSLK